ncbi:MAG TPA: DNA polymerase I [Candidatus Gemmiger excrementigallinarum]|uniref:DNA polymerase I n=1 Tax=Candidatus Gemmiger excrementigallinarum TaxID=2838609 RepID=A0A9D2ERS9_9FIRM|nr:DNA polymerase I [Candidatus Gemmiger excrementigallinarum]
MKLMVLDGNSLVNRAFFGIKLLTTKDGRYTNAIFGFQNILLNLLTAHQPDAVAIAWDERAPTFRHQAYDGYKATRHGMPEELAQQMPVLKELLTHLGFVQVSKEGWEADDILGTLAAACEAKGGTTLLATGDRDSLQLVDDATTVLLATNKETIPMDPAAIREKYGVDPAQLIDVKSLMGDSSDNIPGVPGIGEKTALALVQKFGSLQAIYDHIDNPAIKPGQRTKLGANRDKAELSYMLGTIRKDAPIDTDPAAYTRQPGDAAAAAHLLASLEMHKLIDRWQLESGSAPAAAEAAPLETVEPSPLPLVVEGRLYLAQNSDGSWYAVQDGQVFLPDTDRLTALLDGDAELWVFDAKPLYHLALDHGGIGKAIRFDGKLAAYLLNPSASGYAVKNLAGEYDVPAAFACEAAPDAGVLTALLDKLAAALDESEQRKLHDEMELPLARVLADMERIGFGVDAEGIRTFGDSLRSELDGILQSIYEEVGYEFNVNSPKQLGEALFDKLGLPPRKKTSRGYSTDAETLESLRPYSPVIDQILKYRTYAKLLSTYVDGLLAAQAADGRVHSTFIQTEARTGRISSTEPNLQNIPIRTELGSRLRGFFVAGEGKELVDADYSQIELRILAHITGDEAMQQAFLHGADIHRSTAAKIYHIPESEVTPQLRSASKAINFGIMYGKGAYSLSKDLDVPVKEADNFLKTYLATFPKVDGYMQDCIAHAKEKGYVETLFGRRRALPELASSNFQVRASGERMARNTPIQGTAADIIKLAMVHVWQRLRDEKLEARLLLQVHDELIVEAPEAEVEEVKRVLREEMEQVVQYSVPLTTDVGIGKTWLEAH